MQTKNILPLMGLIILLLSGAILVRQFIGLEINNSMDTYYTWVEGNRILEGENPYSRIHTGNMQENRKYATYFPLFYELSALSVLLGLDTLSSWSIFWRTIISIFHLEISILIYVVFIKRGYTLLGLFSALFWIFYRWPLYDLRFANIESIPIFFLIVSILLFDQHPRFSLFMYSLSLAIKQIGIFLLPLFIIWILKNRRRDSIKSTLISVGLIASGPLISSIPFLFWDLSGFVKSIWFSVTRQAASHMAAPSIDTLFHWESFVGRLPMLTLLALFFILAWKTKIGKFSSAFIVMTVFIGYNPVLFLQYFTWMSVLVPLILLDYLPDKNSKSAPKSNLLLQNQADHQS